jgi:hypothetical protein
MTAMPKTHEAWRLHAPDDLRLDEGKPQNLHPMVRWSASRPPRGCQAAMGLSNWRGDRVQSLDLTALAP